MAPAMIAIVRSDESLAWPKRRHGFRLVRHCLTAGREQAVYKRLPMRPEPVSACAAPRLRGPSQGVSANKADRPLDLQRRPRRATPPAPLCFDLCFQCCLRSADSRSATALPWIRLALPWPFDEAEHENCDGHQGRKQRMHHPTRRLLSPRVGSSISSTSGWSSRSVHLVARSLATSRTTIGSPRMGLVQTCQHIV